MGTRLKNKVAVVTGSGQGIGRAIALGLAEEGAKLVVNNRSPNTPNGTAADVAKEIKDAGGEAVAVFADISTMDGGQKVIQAAIDNFGKIDILVNNAGFSRYGMIWDLTEEDLDMMIAVHLKGHFICTKLASIPMMEQRSGRIINTCARSALYGRAGRASVGAAKGAIAGLTRSTSRELGPYGITVNAICPSADTKETIASREFDAAAGIARHDYLEARDTEKRDPKDVAPLVVFLASDEAADANGNIFYIGGAELGLITRPNARKTIKKEVGWTVDELSAILPSTLTAGLINPAPPQQPK